jgi:hypothetical protein
LRAIIQLTIELAGWFTWDGGSFSLSAEEIDLRAGQYLEAKLRKRDGRHRERQGINLNDRISNVNGKLTYGKHPSCPCV